MLTILVACVIAAGGMSHQDLPAVTESHGAFGFPNTEGTEIIVVHEMSRPAERRTAICAGRVLPIRFVRHQAVTSERANRYSPEQFDRLAGAVFQVVGQRAQPEDTCFVATSSLLEGAELLPVHPRSEPATCTGAERRRFAALRQRAIKACWSLAELRPQGLIGVVEYVRAGRDALASLIVLRNDRAITIDFPAEYRGEGEDMWRAGDGGEFYPTGFRVPFIVRRGATYFVAIDWSAEEGNSLSLYVSEPQTPARQLIHDYWYRAPR